MRNANLYLGLLITAMGISFALAAVILNDWRLAVFAALSFLLVKRS